MNKEVFKKHRKAILNQMEDNTVLIVAIIDPLLTEAPEPTPFTSALISSLFWPLLFFPVRPCGLSPR